MVQTAEGALEEAGNIAQRMRELGVQAGNDTLSAEDRTKVKEELKHVKNYLFIQHFRYSDLFDYTIDCDEEILSKSTITFH